jgi:hypothetical protein
MPQFRLVLKESLRQLSIDSASVNVDIEANLMSAATITPLVPAKHQIATAPSVGCLRHR